MISKMNNITNSEVKISNKELDVLGKAVENSFNENVENLMPYYQGINVEEHFVLHPYTLIEDICLIRGFTIDYSEMSEKAYIELSDFLLILNVVEDIKRSEEPLKTMVKIMCKSNQKEMVRNYLQHELYELCLYEVDESKIKRYFAQKYEHDIKLLPHFDGVKED